jgi:hypothetical protein
MKRTTIMAPEDLLERLHAIARAEGLSLAEVMRQGLEMRAAQPAKRPRFFGAGRSTEPPFDAGRRAGEIQYTPGSWR